MCTALSVCVGLDASDALSPPNKRCVGEGATQERRRSDGEPEEDCGSSVAAPPLR